MRLKSIFPVILLLFNYFFLTAQETPRIPEGISVAFKAGNAVELTKYMISSVELLLLENADFYKRNVAEAVLIEFFADYPVEDFIIRHQGAKNDARYAIGILKTGKGDFRIYFLLKKVEEDLLIHLIRIERENAD